MSFFLFSGIFSDQDKNLQWESSPISSEKLNIFYDNDLKCELSLEIGCRKEQLNSSFSSVFNPFSNDGQVNENAITFDYK